MFFVPLNSEIHPPDGTVPDWAPSGPADPKVVRALIAFSRSTMTRRRFLAGATTTIGAAAAGALAGCAPPVPPSAGTTTRSLPADTSAADKIVRFANWTQYLDRTPGGASPTMSAFTAQTGIKVDYAEEIDDNDTYVNTISPRMRAGQDVGRDLVVFSDWMVNRLIRNGLLAPLDLIRIPHAVNLLEKLKDVSFDPGRRHSLVWQSGFAGIGYHKGRIGRSLKSVDDLWAKDLAGKVVLLSEMRDTLGMIMLAQGVDPAGHFDRTAIERAADVVRKEIADGQVRRIRGNSYLEDLKSGNALAGMVWSGDIATLREETGSDDWEFILPDSGGLIWSDNAVVPITSPHRKAAAQLLNYYYTPAVAAQVAAAVGYVCPVQGAQNAAEKIDPELAANPLIFPEQSFIEAHAREFRALTPAEDAEYSALWAKVVGN
ncbi:spermidine/putrescine transport system substrate-binding protein [Austwickia chelonae]|uniref:Putative ABC transporter substrate-binding protein n=1 Tax=Austwickia chelonae NBRC 105200 TaxID=1184607 RepID=K6W417_9MICO|nr:putative ABC transporter substrate-binding protein [Austwickia chelonae NBRC 105200]SEW26403.1 spermidine/putrescine transport system substrate-binding protein [Austwickia chelonae]